MLIELIAGVALVQAGAPSSNEVTIYNQGFGFIKEVRRLNLRQGRQTVAVENVAALIEPNSVSIRGLADPGAFTVLEQNYQFDLISPMAILNKAVGQQITFHRVLPNGSKETLRGTLLSSPTAVVNAGGGSDTTYNGMVIRTEDGRIVLNPSGEIEVSSLPDGLISKPTLLWDLDAARSGDQPVELSYLTQGMNWNADYVLTLDGMGAADLRGWVTLTNNSGVTFENATLKLLAGDVQRAEAPRGRGGLQYMAADAAGKEMFQEEALFEYHLYTLQRPATVRNREMKQVSLLEALGVKVQKRLIVDSMMNYGMYYPGEGEIGTGVIKPVVRVEFKNTAENQLGIPLPMGNVKVYQRDKSGSVQMLGEDRIQHTPKEETLSLAIGRSFDVVAERKRLSYQRLSDRSFRETFEVEVRNRKDVYETVYVLERHYGDWKVTAQTAEWTRPDSTTLQFVLNLKAGEVRKVTYTIETRW